MPTNLAVAPDRTQPDGKTAGESLQVFSTCPSSLTTPDDYVHRIADVARWSEAAGCTGILVYTDNSLVDPWLVSQIIIQSTHSLCPLIAVQPETGGIHAHHSGAFIQAFAGYIRGTILQREEPDLKAHSEP